MLSNFVCPICAGTIAEPHLQVKDYSVSQLTFNLNKCTTCQLVVTTNAPNQTDIAQYYKFDEYISHTNTNKGLINKLYHKVRQITLLKKYNWVKKYTKKDSGILLDIGCGTGSFLHTMQLHNWTTKGLEPDAKARENAKKLYSIDALQPTELYNIETNSYDAVTMWHVLEHVHELQGYITQIKNILTTNGKLFIAVPNYTSYDAQYYNKYWAAYDVPRHLYHFAPNSIAQLATLNGFTLEATLPMWFDSYYVSMLSEKYKKGNIIRAFAIGLVSNCKALFSNKKCSSIVYVLSK